MTQLSNYIVEVDPSPLIGNEQVAIRPEAFDDFVNAQGAEFVHYRAMRCPLGLTDLYASRRTHDDHAGCSNGFVYKPVGKVVCTFSSSGANAKHSATGIIDASRAHVTVSRLYIDSEEPVQLANFDRLYLSEDSVTVVNWELFEAHQMGIDKLHFPVEYVEHLLDANGQEYKQGADFAVRDGKIVWGRHRPGVQSNGKGVICTARYRYRPYWYVASILHESRFAKVPDKLTGGRKIVRMPYECELQREYFFENQENDVQAPVSARQYKGPADGGFGAR